MRRAKADTVSGAMRILSKVVEAPDNMPEALLIDDLSALSLDMLAMLRHDTALPAGCPACAMRARLADLGVVS